MSWQLPTTVFLGEGEYAINSDYRDILLLLQHMNGEDAQQGALTALYLFYEDFESIPYSYQADAWQALCDFIRCGQTEDNAQPAKLIDWEQDASMIAADVNKVACCEIRELLYMHWYTFMGYFSAVGEGQLSTVVAIRSKLAKGKKLDKWESEFYKEHKSRVEFKKSFTLEEQDEKSALLRLLGE